MRVGVLTGTGTYAFPGGGDAHDETVGTGFGDVRLTRLEVGEVEVLHISRHETGHRRLSNHVAHRANIAALMELEADAVVAVTVCGAVDPTVPLGSLIVFDDLHFLANRLADGSLCTLYDQPGDRLRGHWIYESPFAPGLREVLLAASREAGVPARDGGCYGHVDGPRFNTKAEIRSRAAALRPAPSAPTARPRRPSSTTGARAGPYRSTRGAFAAATRVEERRRYRPAHVRSERPCRHAIVARPCRAR